MHDNKAELELEESLLHHWPPSYEICLSSRRQPDRSNSSKYPLAPMENVSFGATVRSHRIAHCKISALGPMASSPSQITSVMRISGARLQFDLELEHGPPVCHDSPSLQMGVAPKMHSIQLEEAFTVHRIRLNTRLGQRRRICNHGFHPSPPIS